MRPNARVGLASFPALTEALLRAHDRLASGQRLKVEEAPEKWLGPYVPTRRNGKGVELARRRVALYLVPHFKFKPLAAQVCRRCARRVLAPTGMGGEGINELRPLENRPRKASFVDIVRQSGRRRPQELA